MNNKLIFRIIYKLLDLEKHFEMSMEDQRARLALRVTTETCKNGLRPMISEEKNNG